MIYFLKATSKIIAFILGLIFIAITIAWSKKSDKYYRIISIDEWKNMNLLNNSLKKRKAILEKKVIKIVLEKEELE